LQNKGEDVFMKAVIFNSGLGKRMGELTKNNPKSMVKLHNGETIFERQIRLLREEGITEFLITTGPFEEQLKAIATREENKNLHFTFVHNPDYETTNYIYSMYLAKEFFNDDVLMMHGDLVFDRKLLQDILKDMRMNLATVNRQKQLPEKDFKARVQDGKITEVSIHIFDDDCFAFQPFYKLSKEMIQAWLKNVEVFIEAGIKGVYAENAFNEISDTILIEEFSYENYFIDEVDNKEDLERVSKEIRLYDFKEQSVQEGNDYNLLISMLLKKYHVQKPLIIAGSTFQKSTLKQFIEDKNIPYVLFNQFHANPTYEEVIIGVKLFHQEACDYLISFGGGSAIDVAKCIKLFQAQEQEIDYLEQVPRYTHLKHLAIPTTAGTGSEATHFAVLYKDNEKKSIAQDFLLPEDVLLDASVLKTLPDYQKKSTLMDALCQAIESYWSLNATEESKKYAKEAIQLILENIKAYFHGESQALPKILKASHLAGKAINLSKTTAAHAMSYKITSLYGLAHGHAVAICMPSLMRYMENHMGDCIDARGKEYLETTFQEINDFFHTSTLSETATKIEDLLSVFELNYPFYQKETEIDELASSVNIERLQNNPIPLTEFALKKLYLEIVKPLSQDSKTPKNGFSKKKIKRVVKKIAKKMKIDKTYSFNLLKPSFRLAHQFAYFYEKEPLRENYIFYEASCSDDFNSNSYAFFKYLINYKD